MADKILSFNEVVPLLSTSPANVAHVSTDATDATALGKRLVTTNVLFASVQFNWTGLDAADGTITVECNDTGVVADYIQKATATYTLPAGSGVNSFSLNGVVTEDFYRVRYAPGANTTGTISCVIYAKTHGV